MIIILTPRAIHFAEIYEGQDALRARVELEVEQLFETHVDNVEHIGIHIFSWNGTDNMVMHSTGPCLMVDLNDDDGEDMKVSVPSLGGTAVEVMSLAA